MRACAGPEECIFVTQTGHKPPLFIAVGGLSGSGKSTLARALAAALPDAVMIDSDVTRKEMFGVARDQRLPPEAYASEVTQKMCDLMEERCRKYLAEGKSVVMSQTFHFPGIRERQEDIAAGQGARFLGIWLEADVGVLCDRVTKRKGDASDASAEIVKMQSQFPSGPVLWSVLDASQPPEDVFRAAMALVSSRSSSFSHPRAGGDPETGSS